MFAQEHIQIALLQIGVIPELDFGVAEYLNLSVDIVRKIIKDKELAESTQRIIDQFY